MKGRLVSNTGPIIALSAIDHLEILRRIFSFASILQFSFFSDIFPDCPRHKIEFLRVVQISKKTKKSLFSISLFIYI